MTILNQCTETSPNGLTTYTFTRIVSPILAPDELITAAVVIAMDQQQKILLAHNPKRGWELPGGRREANEAVSQTAIREVMEETSVSIDKLKPIGHIKIEVNGPRPGGYPFPYPVRYCQMFVASIVEIHPFVAAIDSIGRQLVTKEEWQSQQYALEFQRELLWLPYVVDASTSQPVGE
jgi:8-oxo-dGTP pyrophosphatase MutT (NUDIX family)